MGKISALWNLVSSWDLGRIQNNPVVWYTDLKFGIKKHVNQANRINHKLSKNKHFSFHMVRNRNKTEVVAPSKRALCSCVTGSLATLFILLGNVNCYQAHMLHK